MNVKRECCLYTRQGRFIMGDPRRKRGHVRTENRSFVRPSPRGARSDECSQFVTRVSLSHVCHRSVACRSPLRRKNGAAARHVPAGHPTSVRRTRTRREPRPPGGSTLQEDTAIAARRLRRLQSRQNRLVENVLQPLLQNGGASTCVNERLVQAAQNQQAESLRHRIIVIGKVSRKCNLLCMAEQRQ